MNTIELNNTLKCLDHFVGTFPKDQIPLVTFRPCSYVINLDDSSNDGSHWIALFVNEENEAIYFDSFGRPPLACCLEIVNILMNLSGEYWIYNDKRLQSIESDACGFYCTLFILLLGGGANLREFQKLFTQDYQLNDLLVKEIVKSYINKVFSKEHNHK